MMRLRPTCRNCEWGQTEHYWVGVCMCIKEQGHGTVRGAKSVFERPKGVYRER